MAATKVVIIYSPNQNLRRTVIIPSDDSEVRVHAANIHPGEAVLVGTLADYQKIGPDAMVLAATGIAPTSDRCAVVDHTGKVAAVVKGDPLIDSHPLGTLVAHPMAITGGRLINGIYAAPVASAVAVS